MRKLLSISVPGMVCKVALVAAIAVCVGYPPGRLYAEWNRGEAPSWLMDGGWESAGFSIPDADAWWRSGIATAQEAKKWQDAGFVRSEVGLWRDNGIAQAADAKDWKDAGVLPAEAGYWVRQHRTAADVRTFKSRGMFPHEVVWHDVGISTGEAKVWEDANFSTFTFKSWRDSNISPSDAATCRNNGYAAAEAVAVSHALTDKSRLAEVCGSLPEKNLVQWRKNFTLPQILEWYPYFEYEQALAWKRIGFSVSEARQQRGFGPDGAIAVKKQCPQGVVGLYSLLSTNPYDVQGKCFEFAGDTMQLLSRTTGLFTQSGQVFYVDFGQKSIPNLGFSGIVKGVGVYEYVTRLGVAKKIPHLKKVWVTG